MKQIYYGLLGLCLVTLLINYRKLGKKYIWFIPILLLAIFTQVGSEIINWGRPTAEKEYYLFHIYTPIEYSLLSLFYREQFRNKYFKRLILLSVFVFIGFAIYYYATHKESFHGPDFKGFTIEAILISLVVVVFFIDLFKSPENIKLSTYPAFWINTGNLFFYSGCLFIMGLYFYLYKRNSNLAQSLSFINYYLNLLLYTFYLIGFSCRR